MTASSSTTGTETQGAIEQNLSLDAVSARPAALWARYREWKGLPPEADDIVLQDYYDDGSGKGPRYYQASAINAAIEAIAKGQNRLLLVMATGTGKTYTAFQIIWRLWKAGRKKRILFLADRNVLIDQTMVNDFRPFGAAMAKLSTERQGDRAARTAPTSSCRSRSTRSGGSTRRTRSTSALYQAITGPEERQKLFRELSPDFFDLIVVDECHRGSAAEDSAWREILELLLRRHADRHDRHAEGDEVRLEHPLLRRAGLHLLAEAGHPGRLPGAVQGRQGPHRPRRRGLPAGAGQDRSRRRRGRGPDLQPEGLRPHARHRRPDEARREEGLRLPQGERGPVPEDDRLLRRHGARRADAAGARQRERDLCAAVPALRDADHRQRQGGRRAARQLHRSRSRSSRSS